MPVKSYWMASINTHSLIPNTCTVETAPLVLIRVRKNLEDDLEYRRLEMLYSIILVLLLLNAFILGMNF